MARDRRAGDNFDRHKARPQERRPDRLALWAVGLSVFMFVAVAATAHASSGGVGTAGSGGGPSASPSAVPPGISTQFGSRVLRVGMEGPDVQVLNAIVKSKRYAAGVDLGDVFDPPTEGAVKEFQGEAGLPTNGVVNQATSSALVHSMSRAGASWYGPGFYGHQTACGKVLRHATIGVANRTLPCGTKVTLGYHGHYVVAPVIDRGPYARGYMFDLTGATAQALGITESVNLRYAVAQVGSDTRGL